MPSKPEHGNKSTAGGKGSSAALGKDSGGSDRGGGTGGRNSEGAAKFSGKDVKPRNLSFQGLSFFFKVNQLYPDFDEQPKMQTTQGYWKPPDKKGAYTTVTGDLYHWQGGSVGVAQGSDVGAGATFGIATIFTQKPDTDHLLAVNLDARAADVCELGGWRPLQFEHRQIGGTSPTALSIVNPEGTERQLAAPGSCDWVPQLLPHCYQMEPKHDSISGKSIEPIFKSGGMAGRLPILIGLAVFSAPPTKVDEVLTKKIQPHRWVPHDFANGRALKHRGLVVTVYLDRSNETGSTASLLRRLERGDFGAFYR